jgi:hypothetical protein
MIAGANEKPNTGIKNPEDSGNDVFREESRNE